MNPMNTMKKICYPDSFTPLGNVFAPSESCYQHTHPNYGYIIKNVEHLITPGSDQKDVEKIRNLILKTYACLSSLESLLPKEKTAENAELRKEIKRQIAKDKRILGFFELCFVQVSLAKVKDKQEALVTVKEKQDALKLKDPYKKRWTEPHK